MAEIEPDPQSSELSTIVDRKQFNIELQNYYSKHSANSKKLEWTKERIQTVIKLLEEYNLAKSQGIRPTNKQYHHANKYDVMKEGTQRILIMKRKKISDPVIRIIPSEEYYHKLLHAHVATGHGRRDKIVNAVRDKYMVPIFAVTIFLNLCKTCLSKKTGNLIKPFMMMTDDFNHRGLIDIVDFQDTPDGDYEWLLCYYDLLTKFCFLRPLRNKMIKEVSIEMLKIFLEVGCPQILQTVDGHEATASIIQEINNLWPDCKMLIGRHLDKENLESAECSNQDIKTMIQAWMINNKSTNWSVGCYFVQFQRNSSHNSTIGRTPFKALFGDDPKLEPSSTSIPKNILSILETEEELERIYEEINKVRKEKISLDRKSNLELQEEVSDDFFSMNLDNPEINGTLDVNNTDQGNINIEQDYLALDQATQSSKYNRNNIENISKPSEEINNFFATICHSCNKIIPGVCTCIKCNQIVHTICGVISEDKSDGYKLQCNLCNESKNISEKSKSQVNLKRLSEKVILDSTKKFKNINVGSSIIVEVPKLNNILGSRNSGRKIVHRKNELHRVGTAFGIIKDWMLENAVLSTPTSTLLNNITQDKSLPHEQGKKKCNCKTFKKGQCFNQKCKCKKANVSCNSRCHSSMACGNKRSSPFPSYPPTMVDMDMTQPTSSDPNAIKPFHNPWYPITATPQAQVLDHLQTSMHNEDSSSSTALSADENSSYFQFFRGIHSDYLELTPKKQRRFKRKCLDFLHTLLDDEETNQTTNYFPQGSILNLSNSGHISEEEKDIKPVVEDGYVVQNN